MRILSKGLMGAFVAASVLGTTPVHAGVSAPAKAPRYHQFEQTSSFHRSKKHHRHDERLAANSRVWRGDDGRYYCKKDNGTTGLLIGGAVGGLAGHEIAGNGDKLLGTVLGAAGGALLGREIDRDKYRCR